MGFGLTVTPRSTAAVESAGRSSFGVASAVVTVARMIGMAVGLAILTAYGSTTIDRLADEVYATPGAYLDVIPEELRDRPLRDPFVVQALEEWASREAASIMVGLFVVAAAVTALAVPPSLALGGRAGSRTRMLGRGPASTDAINTIGGDRDPRRRTRRRWPRATRTRARPLTLESRSPGGAVVHHRAARRSGTPGAIRVVAVVDGELRDTVGDAAITDLPGLLAEADAAIWVDLTSPTQDLALRVGGALDLHPLIIEDVLEGNQRAKIETTEGVIHIVLFNLIYGERVVASELDFVLGSKFLLTVHDADWDPRASNHLRSGVEPVLRHGPDHMLWALADSVVDAYFPFADRLGDAIDEVQDEVVRTASGDTVERLFYLKRELIEVRRAISPVREVFNQLTNRDTVDHRRRGDPLLPGHLRPRHPPDRRARQPSRARGRHARCLPDPGQQQPVGDHEAPDRRDRDRRRRRGGRGDLRDERGRSALAGSAKAPGSGS